MALRWASATAAALVAAAPAAAQQVRELGIQAVTTLSDPVVGVGGIYGALRFSERARVSLLAAGGVSDGQAAWRGELLAHFLLAPQARRGVAPYGAGGLAVVAGAVERGYLVLTLGLESRPGGSSGWFLEAGVGGGARLSAGWRRRWFPGWWPLAR